MQGIYYECYNTCGKFVTTTITPQSTHPVPLISAIFYTHTWEGGTSLIPPPHLCHLQLTLLPPLLTSLPPAKRNPPRTDHVHLLFIIPTHNFLTLPPCTLHPLLFHLLVNSVHNAAGSEEPAIASVSFIRQRVAVRCAGEHVVQVDHGSLTAATAIRSVIVNISSVITVDITANSAITVTTHVTLILTMAAIAIFRITVIAFTFDSSICISTRIFISIVIRNVISKSKFTSYTITIIYTLNTITDTVFASLLITILDNAK